MRILWITNGLFAYHFSLIGKEPPASSSGSWLYAAYEGAKSNENIDLHVATVSNVERPLSGCYDNIHFYILPGGNIFRYDIKKSQNTVNWMSIKEQIKSDLIIIWGSESRFSYHAMQIFSDIPKLIYVQGVMNCIIGHLDDGIPERNKMSTIRDYLDMVNPRKQSKDFIKQAKLEKMMFMLANGVIIENDWCETQCRVLNSKLKIFYNKLPIRNSFFEKKWDIDMMIPYTIFTNAAGVAYKGHHILFQALSIVKKVYSQVKLYIPGANYINDTKHIIHRTGYFNWLHKLYKDNNLNDNIIFTGTLTSDEMSEYISKCNVYVMPSMVENHSSSLIEALLVGAPCISSLVGGSASIIKHGINGYLYNSLEVDTLAGYIFKLFENRHLCKLLSSRALDIRKSRLNDFGEGMFEIYKDALKLN